MSIVLRSLSLILFGSSIRALRTWSRCSVSCTRTAWKRDRMTPATEYCRVDEAGVAVVVVVVVGVEMQLGDSWLDESSQSKLELTCCRRLLAFGWVVEGPPASMSTRTSRYVCRFGWKKSRRGGICCRLRECVLLPVMLTPDVGGGRSQMGRVCIQVRSLMCVDICGCMWMYGV